MTIGSHISEFAGKRVVEFEGSIKNPEKNAYRLSVSYDDGDGADLSEKIEALANDPNAKKLEALVIGQWVGEMCDVDSQDVVDALVEHKDKFPKLEAIFLGDITMEESEISWIQQGNMTELFQAYPKLTHFCVRGSVGLSLGDNMDMKHLRSLTVQCGGLPRGVVKEIASAKLPALEHLELWLGEDNYGASFEMDDLKPILSGKLFPKLIYLGLKNSENQDEVAVLVAESPILDKIRVLDMSMGTLSDDGVAAILRHKSAKNLELLDIHHHFVSEEMVKKLEAAGIKVDASERKEAEDMGEDEPWRYIAVSE